MKSLRVVTPLVFTLALVAFAPTTWAQDRREADDVRRQIMAEVEARMEKHGRALMEDIERLVNQVLQERGRNVESQRRIRELEREVERLRRQLAGNRGTAAGRAPADVAEPSSAPPAILGFAFDSTNEDQASKLGIKAQDSIQITRVLEGSPAASAGLKPGDIITRINGKDAGRENFLSEMQTKRPGDRVSLEFARNVDGLAMRTEVKARLVSRERFARAIAELQEGSGAVAPEAVERRPERRPEPRPQRAAGGPVRLGMTCREQGNELVIIEVESGGNAAEAGLREGDVLLGLGGRRVNTIDGVKEVITQLRVGQESTMRVRRGENTTVYSLVFGGEGRKAVLKGQRTEGSERRGRDNDREERRPAGRGFLGVELEPVDGGIRVVRVIDDSAAADMGLRAGDVITSINRTRTDDLEALRGVLGDLRARDRVRIEVRRGDDTRTVRGRLGARPENPEQASAPAPKPVKREPGALGVLGRLTAEGLAVESVFDFAHARKAGVRAGDRIVKIGDRQVDDSDALRTWLGSRNAGERVTLTVVRDGDRKNIDIELTARARLEQDAAATPAAAPAPQAQARNETRGGHLGVVLEELGSLGRIRVLEVDQGGPAHRAGLRKDDEILGIGEKGIRSLSDVRGTMDGHRAGDRLTFDVRRDGEPMTITVTLGSL